MADAPSIPEAVTFPAAPPSTVAATHARAAPTVLVNGGPTPSSSAPDVVAKPQEPQATPPSLPVPVVIPGVPPAATNATSLSQPTMSPAPTSAPVPSAAATQEISTEPIAAPAPSDANPGTAQPNAEPLPTVNEKGEPPKKWKGALPKMKKFDVSQISDTIRHVAHTIHVSVLACISSDNPASPETTVTTTVVSTESRWTRFTETWKRHFPALRRRKDPSGSGVRPKSE